MNYKKIITSAMLICACGSVAGCGRVDEEKTKKLVEKSEAYAKTNRYFLPIALLTCTNSNISVRELNIGAIESGELSQEKIHEINIATSMTLDILDGNYCGTANGRAAINVTAAKMILEKSKKINE